MATEIENMDLAEARRELRKQKAIVLRRAARIRELTQDKVIASWYVTRAKARISQLKVESK